MLRPRFFCANAFSRTGYTYINFIPTLGKTLVEGDVKDILTPHPSPRSAEGRLQGKNPSPFQGRGERRGAAGHSPPLGRGRGRGQKLNPWFNDRMIMNHTFQVALLTPLTPIMGEGGVRSAT